MTVARSTLDITLDVWVLGGIPLKLGYVQNIYIMYVIHLHSLEHVLEFTIVNPFSLKIGALGQTLIFHRFLSTTTTITNW